MLNALCEPVKFRDPVCPPLSRVFKENKAELCRARPEPCDCCPSKAARVLKRQVIRESVVCSQ